MALFAGTYEYRIDRKGRVSLPADFRAELPAEGARVVYVYPSPRGGALEACDRAFMQRMADSLEQFDMFSDEEPEEDARSEASSGPLAMSADEEEDSTAIPEAGMVASRSDTDLSLIHI